MLEYDRIDVTEGIDVNITNQSHNALFVIVITYLHYRFQPKVLILCKTL